MEGVGDDDGDVDVSPPPRPQVSGVVPTVEVPPGEVPMSEPDAPAPEEEVYDTGGTAGVSIGDASMEAGPPSAQEAPGWERCGDSRAPHWKRRRYDQGPPTGTLRPGTRRSSSRGLRR